MTALSIATQRPDKAPKGALKDRTKNEPDSVIALPGKDRQIALKGFVGSDKDRWPGLMISETAHDVFERCCKQIAAALNEGTDNDAAWVRLRLPPEVISGIHVDPKKLVLLENFEGQIGKISVRKTPGNQMVELYFHRKPLCGGPKVKPVLVQTVDLTHRWSRLLRLRS